MQIRNASAAPPAGPQAAAGARGPGAGRGPYDAPEAPPFQASILFALGKRFLAASKWLALVYVVGTLLVQTFIPVAIAAKYATLTHFFSNLSAERANATQAATGQSAAPASAEANANPTPAPSAPPGSAPLSPAAKKSILQTYGIWLGLTVAALGLSFATRYLTASFDQGITQAIRRSVFNRILEQSPRFFHQYPAGRLLIILTQFTTMVAMALRQLLVDPILQLIGIIVVGYALYMQLASLAAGKGNSIWVYFGLIALFSLLSPWFVSRMGRTLSRSTSNVQEQMLAMGTFLEGSLNAPEEIQTLGAESRFDAKHQALLDAALRTRLNQTVTVEKLNLLSQSPATVTLISLIGLAVYLAFDPKSTVDPGTIIALAYLTPQFMGQIQGISTFSINLTQSWPSIVTIDSILKSGEGVPTSPGAKDFERIEPSLAARDLVFSYQPGELRNVLDHISFEVPAGKITGFVARPGQGKTTFFRLLLRFYEPQQGQIVLGGHPIRDFTLQSLRRHVVLMAQFPTFFRDTVRENFLLAKPDATDQEIEELCRKTGLWPILEQNLGSNPLDREFVPGPGKSLSGGQTKLFALTRCLLRSPKVLLLDESTTGMGPKEKFPLIQTMREACKGETVLVVDHDIVWQTRFCDYFIVMSEGKIIQQGRSDQLLAQPGLFKELYDAASEPGAGQAKQPLPEMVAPRPFPA